MSALRLPGLPTLIKLAQELHLFQAFPVCWYWCLSRQKLSCHVKASTSWTLALARVHPGCCKNCWNCTILWKIYPSFWASNCLTTWPNNQTWINWDCCATLGGCHPRFLQQHKTSHLIQSMPETFWLKPPHCLTVRFLVKRVWLHCLPTRKWHCFDRGYKCTPL